MRNLSKETPGFNISETHYIMCLYRYESISFVSISYTKIIPVVLSISTTTNTLRDSRKIFSEVYHKDNNHYF